MFTCRGHHGFICHGFICHGFNGLIRHGRLTFVMCGGDTAHCLPLLPAGMLEVWKPMNANT